MQELPNNSISNDKSTTQVWNLDNRFESEFEDVEDADFKSKSSKDKNNLEPW
jgi:hypothetical protein